MMIAACAYVTVKAGHDGSLYIRRTVLRSRPTSRPIGLGPLTAEPQAQHFLVRHTDFPESHCHLQGPLSAWWQLHRQQRRQ